MDEPRKGEEKKRSTTAKKRPKQSKLKCAKKSANGFYFTSKRQKRKLAVGCAAEEKVKSNIKDSDDNVDDEDDVTKISTKSMREQSVFSSDFAMLPNMVRAVLLISSIVSGFIRHSFACSFYS